MSSEADINAAIARLTDECNLTMVDQDDPFIADIRLVCAALATRSSEPQAGVSEDRAREVLAQIVDEHDCSREHPLRVPAIQLIAIRALLAFARTQPSSDALREALVGIEIYAQDTLSGPTNPADHRERWYADGIREIRNRARQALSTSAIGSEVARGDE